MISLAKLSIRRPKAALAACLGVVIVLSLIGLGVNHSLSPSVTTLPKTDSYRAQRLAEQRFGSSQLVPILLEGPKAQLNREGPKLVAALAKRPNTRVLSAWDAGTASATLRPSPTDAMVIVSVNRPEKDAVKYDAAQIERIVSRHITPPAKAYAFGQPIFDRAWQSAAISTLKTSAAIAIGVLFVLLLIGLRAVLAAALVTVIGIATTLSAFGVMALLGKFMAVDAIALATGAIAGLARGASYSLVMLDRIHRDEERHPARPVDSVLTVAVDSTGRALLYAGTIMCAAMLLADTLGPTDVLATLGIGAFLCTLLATGAAVVVVPAVLALTGPAINRHLALPPFFPRVWDRMVAFGDAITKHAIPVGALATALLLLLAVPTVGVKSGPQDVRQLPADSSARIAYNNIARVMHPGYAMPYDVIVSNPKGPITTNALLTQLNSYEKKIAHDPAVDSVTGPGGAFTSNATQLKKFWPAVLKGAKLSDQSKKDLLKLINGLGQAGAGSAQLQSGLAQASSGANQIHNGTTQLKAKSAEAASGAAQLHSGSAQAQSGAGQLHSGLAQAKAGSAKLQAGLGQALSGALALKRGSAQVLAGSNQLVNGLGQAQNGAKPVVPGLNALSGAAASTSAQVNTALAQLNAMTSAKSDPSYAAVQRSLAAAAGTAGATKALAASAAQQAPALINGINQLHTGAGQLAAGIQQLHTGNAQLASGIGQLAGGGGQLTNGLSQLTAGAGALQIGLGQLTSGTGQLASGLAAGLPQVGLLNAGTGQLASGLSGGVGPAGQLTSGLGLMQAEVIKSRGKIPSTQDLLALQKQSPGLFSSGYFVLAAVEGAPAASRNAAQFMINLPRGGNTAQIVVTSRFPVSDKRTEQLGGRLRAMAASFAKVNHLNVAVGGPAGSLFDVARVANSKLPAVLIGTFVVITLLLGLFLRSILIPTLGVLSAALTTAAGMGLIWLLFGGSNPPLGGPGIIDPITQLELLATMFGATLLYIVVLLTRTRDLYVETGDARRSLVRAMGSTVAATSGIAAITIGVVVPFAFSGMIGVRIIAVAAGISVFLVAYLILPVWLPAAVSLAGRLGWWPTHGPRRESPAGGADAVPARKRRRHLPHRHPRPAH